MTVPKSEDSHAEATYMRWVSTSCCRGDLHVVGRRSIANTLAYLRAIL